MRWLLASVLALLVTSIAGAAQAHQVGISRGEYTADGNVVRVELTFARADAELLPPSAELVRVAGCTGAFDGFEPTEADGLRMRIHYTCPTSVFSIDASFIEALGRGHRHMANAGGAMVVLQSQQTHVDLAGSAPAPSSGPSLGKLVLLGVEHILTGWDHLAFLFGLILLGGRLRALGLTISAFTVAHSITLGLAAFGLWTPPSSIIEPAIALSIAWVGVENVRALLSPEGGSRTSLRAKSLDFSQRISTTTDKRWRITFPFGLVHGFGFAGALSDLGMSRSDVPKALFGFNLGVELGQLAVVIPLALGLAWIGRRGLLPERAVTVASVGIVALGVVWFALRVA